MQNHTYVRIPMFQISLQRFMFVNTTRFKILIKTFIYDQSTCSLSTFAGISDHYIAFPYKLNLNTKV